MRQSKYQTLKDYFSRQEAEVIKLSFNEIENILGFKFKDTYRKHRQAWANNDGPLSWAWMSAGYLSYDVNMEKEVAHFRKAGAEQVITKQNPRVKEIFKKEIKVPSDEILLNVPLNLTGLENDEYYMVKLTKNNSEIVESELCVDPGYRQIGKEAFKRRMENDKDFSFSAYYEVINRIATENSTRTSKRVMELLAEYLSNSKNNFLARLEEGKPQLVDDLLNYLVSEHERRDKSLVSKICRYLNEWLFNKDDYTINDSVVRKVLPYYLAYYKIDKELWYGLNFEILTYVEFISLFDLVKDKVNVLSRHELDHLIWYSYKNDSIRSSIAASLALYL